MILTNVYTTPPSIDGEIVNFFETGFNGLIDENIGVSLLIFLSIILQSRDISFFCCNSNFKKSIIYAVNCGDDTDCTAATAGALLGIIHGHAALPEKWKSPIGKKILTKCVRNLQ